MSGIHGYTAEGKCGITRRQFEVFDPEGAEPKRLMNCVSTVFSKCIMKSES